MTRTREEIELDLPFFVNGTLGAEGRAEFESAMAGDARLAAERDAMAVIRHRMQAEEHRSPGEFGLARLMRDVDRQDSAPKQAGNRPWIWQTAAAAAFLALVGQTLLMTGDTNQTYELAGAGEAGALIVTFAPEASEVAIRETLLTAGVEIVGGPSALGLYRLDARDGIEPDAAAQSLRAAATIVESVENVLE